MTVDIASVTRIGRQEAPGLAAEEYGRLAALASELTADEWRRPTDCPGWTVADVLAHVAGAMAGTSFREGARQRKAAQARAAASGRPSLDELNQLHVDERSGRTTAEIAAELRDRAEPAVSARRRVPALLRRAPIPGSDPPMRMAELLDVVLTRSTWMHRVDVCRATGRPLQLTAAHDGRIVADVVRDWADRHGRPFTLSLTGEAGGAFERPGDGAALELDAVEFCRTLSGRAAGDGLLATPVVF